MRSSLGRYLLLRVVVPAALINPVLGALFAIATFPAGREVPVLGVVSACGDTLVASFLIGLLTMIGVAPTARMEARSGRVRGLGSRQGWLAWSTKRLLLSALALGVAWLLLVGFPAAKAIQARWTGTMPRDAFIAFKAAFAGVFGVLAAVVAALRGIAGEAEVAPDPRWCLEPAASPGPVYPCDFTDKAALAITNRERGSSGTPTWDLHVRGAIEPEHVKRALADLATRYPSITTRVQALDGVPPFARKYRYAHDPSFRVDAIFDIVDTREREELEAVARERRNRHLDLYTEFPVTLTMAVTGVDSSRLIFRQHHAIADGRAFIALLVDFAALLNDARAGRRPAPGALEPIGRRGELEALALTPLKQASYTVSGVALTLVAAVRTLLTPLTPLLQNLSNDYSGENGTVHWALPDGVLEQWGAARKRFGVSLNTLLTGALMLANQRVHRAKGLPTGRTTAQLLMETRPRDKAFVSFANHLSFLYAEADLAKVTLPEELLRSIQAQVVQQRDRATSIKRLLAERWFVGLVPLVQLQKMIFDTSVPAYSLNFSNLIPLEFADLGGEGWSVDDVRITTPVAPRYGIVLTVIRYRGKLVFNFNYKSSAAPRELAEEVCAEFQKVIDEMAG